LLIYFLIKFVKSSFFCRLAAIDQADHPAVQDLVKGLFAGKTHLSYDIQEILVASLLRHYDDFLLSLQKEPTGKFEGADVSNHCLVFKVNQAKHCLGITDATFTKWKKQVREDFRLRNIFAMDDGTSRIHFSVDSRYVNKLDFFSLNLSNF
jgi:hypothetical protein